MKGKASMKAIVIKQNEKVLFVAKIDEITTKQFLDLQRDVTKTLLDKDLKVVALQNHIVDLEENVKQLQNQVKDLYHQIAIDRGEEEPEGEQE